MNTYRLSTARLPQRELRIRQLATGRPLEWLRQGWADLRAAPLASLVYGAVLAMIAFICTYSTLLGERFVLVPFLVGGFLILSPALSVGLMAIAKRREEESQGRAAPSVWRILSRNRPSLGLMGLFLLFVFINRLGCHFTVARLRQLACLPRFPSGLTP